MLTLRIIVASWCSCSWCLRAPAGLRSRITGRKQRRSSSSYERKELPSVRIAFWEDTKNVDIRLPADHPYVRSEIQDMADQLDNERRLMGDATTKSLLKEMWVVPGNRKRAIISVMLMVWQQMTGVNAIVRGSLALSWS